MKPASAKKIYSKSFWEGMLPDPRMTVSEWADKNRVLSQKASAEPGRWNTARTPYLREIMDCLSPISTIEEVVLMKGAQVGGTECGNNWIGYVIDYAPGPMMAVQPTVDLAKRNSKLRIQPLIEECPKLMEKVKTARERDSGNTILTKDFPGGTLVMTGANSAVGLRSMPARYLFLDEEDGYPGDVDGEGDPSALARARTKTFARRKIFHVSTPTFAGRSRIESGYDSSDRRKYFVPCPLCNHMQHLHWGQIKFEIIKNVVGQDEPRDVHYICESCSGKIYEHHKTSMLSKGEWRAEFSGVRGGKIAGFHLNSLYSPLGWFSWSDAAQQWLDAQGKPEELRGFINTVLGETWKDKGDAPDWKRLYDRREIYIPGSIPSTEIVFLTAGVDVQKDRLEIEIVGWGRDKQSWSVDYIVIPGDTTHESTLRELDKLMSQTWSHAGGLTLNIRMMAIDSGYNTNHIYNWVRRHPINRVMAVKGSDQAALLLGAPSAVDINLAGKRIRRGVKLWPVGVSIAKGELYAWLKQEKPLDGEKFVNGYCHFPEYGDEYFKQLTSEQLVVRIIKGRRQYEWEKTRDRNEALDCRIYARAAAAAIGIDRYTAEHWDQMCGVSGSSLDGSKARDSKDENSSRNDERAPKKGGWLHRHR